MAHDRPDLPYEKAIEEAAKTTGKALDLIGSTSPAIAEAYGFLIGDRLAAARVRNLDEITRKTKKILQDRDAKDAQPLPEQIAAPLLEHAQGEPRSEIQDLYAGLLANAMDPNFTNDVRPEFVSTVRQLQPIDVLVLGFALARYADAHSRVFHQEQITAAQKGQRSTAIAISLAKLIELGCISKHSQGVVLSAYGFEFMLACNPHGSGTRDDAPRAA